MSDILDLDLQTVISLLIWEPRIKRGSFGKAASILNHRVALPALVIKYGIETDSLNYVKACLLTSISRSVLQTPLLTCSKINFIMCAGFYS